MPALSLVHPLAPMCRWLAASGILIAAAAAQGLLQQHAVDHHSVPALGSNLRYVAAGDLDGDGDTDLAACEGIEAAIYLQQAGQFVRTLLYSNINVSPTMAAVADFDGDGFADVVFGPFGSSNSPLLRFWWGDASGQLASATTTDLPIAPDYHQGRIAVCDVDHDGDVDLTMVAPRTSQLHNCILSRNQGNRTFATAPTTQFPFRDSGDSEPFFVDVDGDGWEDLVLVSRNAQTRLYWNNSGNFAEATAAEFPVLQWSLRGLALGDFDRDGDLDLVLGGDQLASVLLTAVAPRRLQPSTGAALPPLRNVALRAVDADGDGDLDLYAFRVEGGQLLRNDGTGAFQLVETFGSCDETAQVVAGDFDGDGDTDQLRLGLGGERVNPRPPSRVAVSYGLGNGRYEHLGDARLPPSAIDASHRRGDIDGDGLLDLWLRVVEPEYPGPTFLQLARNDGRGVFGYEHVERSGSLSRGFFADLDGDGRDELIVPGTSTGYYANSNGVLAATLTPLPIAGLFGDGVALDLDQDGDQDLVLPENYGSLARVRVLIATGGGYQEQTATRVSAPAISGSGSLRAVAADFDGDGDQDVVIGSDVMQMLLRNTGGALAFVPGALPTGVYYTFHSSVGDLDGDGDVDLQLGRRVLLNDGQGMFTDITARVPNVSGNDSLDALIDVDDDGDLDLVGGPNVHWNDGHANFTQAANVSPAQSSGTCVLWTDADRDGDADVLTTISFQQTLVFHTNMLRQLWLTGPARLGGALGFDFHAQPGQVPQPVLVWLLGAFAKAPPTELPGFGWLQLDLNTAFVIGAQGLPAAGGDAMFSIPVPNAPALQSAFVCAQPLELRGGRWRIGNLVQTWLGR